MLIDFRITAKGDVREVYLFQAASREDAEEKWEKGELPQPQISEVESAEIVSIEEDPS